MSRFFRWLFGIFISLFMTGLGAASGIFAAFWYVYFFIDEDRTGNAGIGTNISFLGNAFAFGLLGLIAGAFVAWRLLAWMFLSTKHAAVITSEGVC